eukprot:Sspe_Gene.19187::Locus_6969_Transcript_1_1_Confidence_1.000_Length_1548::g.19187::m.19187
MAYSSHSTRCWESAMSRATWKGSVAATEPHPKTSRNPMVDLMLFHTPLSRIFATVTVPLQASKASPKGRVAMTMLKDVPWNRQSRVAITRWIPGEMAVPNSATGSGSPGAHVALHSSGPPGATTKTSRFCPGVIEGKTCASPTVVQRFRALATRSILSTATAGSGPRRETHGIPPESGTAMSCACACSIEAPECCMQFHPSMGYGFTGRCCATSRAARDRPCTHLLLTTRRSRMQLRSMGGRSGEWVSKMQHECQGTNLAIFEQVATDPWRTRPPSMCGSTAVRVSMLQKSQSAAGVARGISATLRSVDSPIAFISGCFASMYSILTSL